MNTAPEKDEYSRIGDLLGHYSSRAVAHASFFIASIFGIVTLSAVIQQMSEKPWFWFLFLVLSMLLFFGFSYVGYYTMKRFGYYADLAEVLSNQGLRREEVMREILMRAQDNETLLKHFDSNTENQRKSVLLRGLLAEPAYSSPLLAGGYWVGIFLLGLIAYEKFFAVSLGLYSLLFFVGLYVATLLLVILPIIIERYGERTYRILKFWLMDC